MFDRFSDNAKRSMSRARDQAIGHGHAFIAPQHMLLGLLQLERCGAVTMLQGLGIDFAALRARIEATLPPRGEVSSGQLPFTDTAKKVLERTLEIACRASSALGTESVSWGGPEPSHIGTSHLLVGLASVGESVPVLGDVGAEPAKLESMSTATAPTRDRSKQRLLLISNSTMHGGGYLEHCAGEMRDFLGARKRVLFVPYALQDHDSYAAKARQAFTTMGHELISAHEVNHAAEVLPQVEAVFVGGGNTFRLLNALYRRELLHVLQARVRAGMPYIGSSAGTNVATPSIRTTNDMPIVEPPSFTALDLVPFQINPHYLDPVPGNTHMGETREERIRQFLEEHATPVLGLREGCMLRVEGNSMELRGTTRARLFRRDAAAEEFTPRCNLSFLLQS